MDVVSISKQKIIMHDISRCDYSDNCIDAWPACRLSFLISSSPLSSLFPFFSFFPIRAIIEAIEDREYPIEERDPHSLQSETRTIDFKFAKV